MIWRPDTCDCELEILDTYWDNPSEQNCRVIKRCPAHSSHSNLPSVVLRENRAKNSALNVAMTTVAPDTLISFKYDFDAARKLSISFETVTLAADKKALLELMLGGKLEFMNLNDEIKNKLALGLGAIFTPSSAYKTKVEQELGKSGLSGVEVK